MNSLSRTTWLLALATVLSAAAAPAAPLDDAKAQLAQKNYDQVDKVLVKDLASRTPSLEALRLSLNAAIAAGRPVTAEARIGALLKQQLHDPQLLLTGAKVAEILSDEQLALTRYLAYARAETKNTGSLEAALAYVLQHDAYPDELRKYVDTFGPSARAWNLAETQWRFLTSHRDGDRLLALAEFMMQKWSGPRQVAIVHQWLWTACDDYLFGREPRDRYSRAAAVAAKYVPADGGNLRNMVDRSHTALSDQEHVRFLLDLVKTWGFPPPPVVNIGGWFGYARNVKDEAARLRLGQEFLALENIYRQSRTRPTISNSWVRSSRCPTCST